MYVTWHKIDTMKVNKCAQVKYLICNILINIIPNMLLVLQKKVKSLKKYIESLAIKCFLLNIFQVWNWLVSLLFINYKLKIASFK